MLVEGRQQGRVVNKNVAKRTAYTSTVRFEPIPKELASFKELQKVICEKLMLYHLDPDRQLFL
jgi:hypothetical protein